MWIYSLCAECVDMDWIRLFPIFFLYTPIYSIYSTYTEMIEQLDSLEDKEKATAGV